MSTLKGREVKDGWCLGLTTLTHFSACCLKILETLTSWSPGHISRLIQGQLYLYLLHIYVVYKRINEIYLFPICLSKRV
jgi:ABC-type enterochelin transport system permease subunit